MKKVRSRLELAWTDAAAMLALLERFVALDTGDEPFCWKTTQHSQLFNDARALVAKIKGAEK